MTSKEKTARIIFVVALLIGIPVYSYAVNSIFASKTSYKLEAIEQSIDVLNNDVETMANDNGYILASKLNATDEDLDIPSATPNSVYNFIQRRYASYDELEGKDTGDKYTDKVFQEASEYFHISLVMVKKLYDAHSF